MEAQELTTADRDAAVRLWDAAGLTRPWNDPVTDFDRAIASAQSAVLGLSDGGAPIGTVMVGDDGHRGWVYYLAVDPSVRRRGVGAALMAAAEGWLLARGVTKLNLMVRQSSRSVLGFYSNLGYHDDDVVVLSRRLYPTERTTLVRSEG
ncbi:MAG: GNAT family acetyltransferase [Ilumatobacteraceae bacterium]